MHTASDPNESYYVLEKSKKVPSAMCCLLSHFNLCVMNLTLTYLIASELCEVGGCQITCSILYVHNQYSNNKLQTFSRNMQLSILLVL